jgi:hypothetical protein
MLINYIRVFQLSGIPSNVVGQTSGNGNLTGAGGPGRQNDSPPRPNVFGGQCREAGLGLIVAVMLLHSVLA